MNTVKFKQPDGPNSAAIHVNGVEVTGWCRGISVESNVNALPCATIDLVACYPLDVELKSDIAPRFFLPPGYELERIKDNGVVRYRARKLETEGAKCDTVDASTMGSRFRKHAAVPTDTEPSRQREWVEQDG